MGKSISLIGHSALIVSLTAKEHTDTSLCYLIMNILTKHLVNKTVTVRSPHCVKDSPVLHDAEEFVRRGRVMGNRLL